jgi:mannan endo-1,4-beta-mannosidase
MFRLAKFALASCLGIVYAQSAFVQTAGTQLVLNGQPFQFTGSNNYYLMYSPPTLVDSIFQTAVANGFTVMRTWGWIDTGTTDGKNSVSTPPNGIYFHYWDGAQPAFNDGASGLTNLDYVIYSAGQAGVKLIIPFTNNWTDFGGMDQYVAWRGAKTHDAFYTDLTIRGWYQDYINHLLTRVNTFTGIAYKDDPTILGWELANEPRCSGSGLYPSSRACSTATLTNWAGEMASFIKSIDPNHLVSAGDEGFYCSSTAAPNDWTMNCTQGVDTVALAQAPGIDWMSFHLYPVSWGKTPDWGTQWVTSHFNDAASLGRPAIMGEFGYEVGSGRLTTYQQWTDAMLAAQGSGGLFWWLTTQSNYNSFDVACPNAVCLLMSNLGQELAAGQMLSFAPIADDQEFTTTFQTPISAAQAVNAIAYNGAAIDPTTISLGPSTGSQQLTYASSFGTFAVQPDWSVQFTPAANYAGKTSAMYTVADTNGQISNPAQLRVNVTSDPGTPYTLNSFETGNEGWQPAGFQMNAGTVAASTDWSADGTQSLEIMAADGGWFGVSLSPAQNWTGRTQVIYGVNTLGQATSTGAVIQVGSSYLWCQSNFSSVPAGSAAIVTIDLTQMSCGVPDLSKVQSLFIYFSGGGTYYLDQVQIQ